MLTTICEEIKNWFTDDSKKVIGTYSIVDGEISPSIELLEGQYYRIIGSVFNDGVHKYGDSTDTLTDETFSGAIWCMSVPKNFMDLANEITEYQSNSTNSAFTSESFGGYSYTKASGSNGTPATWREVFASRLNMWRKI